MNPPYPDAIPCRNTQPHTHTHTQTHGDEHADLQRLRPARTRPETNVLLILTVARLLPHQFLRHCSSSLEALTAGCASKERILAFCIQAKTRLRKSEASHIFVTGKPRRNDGMQRQMKLRIIRNRCVCDDRTRPQWGQ